MALPSSPPPVSTETVAPPTELHAHNPATGALLGTVRATAPAEVERVVAQARQVQPLWALLRVQDRARYMRRVAQAVIDEFDELLATIACEQGRPPAEIATLELLPAIDALIWIAEDGARVLGSRGIGVHRSLALAKRARVAYEPYGVVGVIGAGSAPFAQPLGQIAGALLAGNAVAFKPARRACLAGERIVRVLARAGLPEGLVRIVHGGTQVGVALARAPVDKVLFTGSPAVGRAVARACVSQEKEVTVELGGKDAMLVLADAHVARASTGALWAGCAGAGQARGAVERIYVERELYERFLTRLVGGARALRVGDPEQAGVQMGPLSSQRRSAHVHELVQDALAQGATLHCGGPLAAPPGCAANAAFYAPAVLSGVTHAMRIMREPLDGPVLAVMSVESTDRAVELANDCDYGLGASVWTADRHRGLRIARELHAGMVWLNDHLPAPTVARGPWGAAAGGGLGRTLGETGLRGCAQEKLITWDPSGARGLWWPPYDELLVQGAHAVARLRSARDSDRERVWRHGVGSLARVGARALRKG
ncbi:MAG TPA: aldehyde dehydrogenase family protein [Solirubrobacteraceae bacterium]|jgi:acyl-CoA reductase-like NAD-dependent aldehyde dehydrogenase|nr:aldehyde dehydrogenase family protein [Solirubrobacteraceae bacterium]